MPGSLRRFAVVMVTREDIAPGRPRRAPAATGDISRHRAALRSAVPVHGGAVVEFATPRSVSTFPSAVEAVRAAIEIQTALASPPPVSVRIGIDQGEVLHEDDRVVGDCVDGATRAQAAAIVGGVAVTGTIADEIRNHPELTVLRLVDRGPGARGPPVFGVAAAGVPVPEGTAALPAAGPSARALSASPAVPPLPLVGREADLDVLRAFLDRAERGEGATLFLAGESGVGKTRLARAAQEEAERRGWAVAAGRANDVETDLPYALLADALQPTMQALADDARQVMTRGLLDELALLFPWIGPLQRPGTTPATRPSADFRNRLFWTLAQFLEDRARTVPLLIVLDDLHWADASSLQLLHFLARRTTSARIAILGTYRTDAVPNAWLGDVERSLASLGVATVHAVQRLTHGATAELVSRTFDVPESVGRPFTALLFGWTRGNPFFIEEVLKTLVETRRLRLENGVWLGWDVDELALPDSVRTTVAMRAARLDEQAGRVAELGAVLGNRFRFDQLEAVTGRDAVALLPIVDDLIRHRLLVETGQGDAVSYEFEHPIVRETLYANLGAARAGVLHGVVAQALEKLRGATERVAVGELAYHYTRAIDGALADKAVRFLEEAGRAALTTHANPEALKSLHAALDRMDAGGVVRTKAETASLISALAHAHQRLGHNAKAIDMWERSRALAREAGDTVRVAKTERRLGLAHYWAGEAELALAHFEAGARAASAAGDTALQAMLHVAHGLCLQELGRAADALKELDAALAQAETLGSRSLLARVHRAYLLIYLWTGPPERATEHGRRALELADQTGDLLLSFWVHWAMAVLAGLSGDADRLQRHLDRCEHVAEEVRSPLLRIWASEIAIEFAFGGGRWDEGLAIGENAISMARVLGQHTLLPRLLVWTALIYLGRHDLVRGKAYVDEAWTLACGAAPDQPNAGPSVHVVIPAHIGRATYRLVIGDYSGAIAVVDAALAIIDRTGYDVWAVHRLLPIAAEASLYLRDLERADRYGARLREGALRFGNRLGLAWADACDALSVWLGGEAERGTELMRAAAAALEAIPFVPDATRLRRQLAGRLADIGDREGAVRELRAVHDALLALGAEKELERTRGQFRELEARLPAKRSSPGAAGLTGRELEVAWAVADGLSNKAIAKQLGISVRTVTTHVSNAFRKLGVSNRVELADVIRSAAQSGELTR